MSLNSIQEIIHDIRAGRMVILMDDEDRENEGDLIMAGSHVRPEDVNFMAKFGRGLICLTLTRERCEQLKLPLMVNQNNSFQTTNFTVSIEAVHGVTTGISAHDRAHTIRTAVAADARHDDLVQPGHVFPLMAQPGGVLTRAGHTEAGCDLARLAELEPAAMIVEILNEDGTMARRPDLEKFAAKHDLKIGTIADLIHYRVENEKTVVRVAECDLPTAYGSFHLVAYQDSIDRNVHVALTLGSIEPEKPTLVRVHLQNTFCDVFNPKLGDCGWPLHRALQRIAREGEGVVVVLRQGEDPMELIRRIRSYGLDESGIENKGRKSENEIRTHGLGAQILADLGVRRMRVLSAPKYLHAISGFGLEVVDYVPCD